MTPAALEVRIIIYAVAFLAFVGLISWGVYTVASHHFERLELVERDARSQIVQQAQQTVILAQAAQHKAEQDAQGLREKLDATNTVARDAALGSLRNTQAAVHALAVSATMANTSGVQGRSAGAGGDPELTAAIGRLDAAATGVDDAVKQAIISAQHDSANYVSILAIEPKQVTKP